MWHVTFHIDYVLIHRKTYHDQKKTEVLVLKLHYFLGRITALDFEVFF